jgi:multicomponent Na+:H+ antiporter subunit F
MSFEIADWVLWTAFAFISVAFVLAFIRLARGPRITDRVLALDLISGLCLGTLILIALKSEEATYLNVAIALAVISFLGTAALARYLERGGARK